MSDERPPEKRPVLPRNQTFRASERSREEIVGD